MSDFYETRDQNTKSCDGQEKTAVELEHNLEEISFCCAYSASFLVGFQRGGRTEQLFMSWFVVDMASACGT